MSPTQGPAGSVEAATGLYALPTLGLSQYGTPTFTPAGDGTWWQIVAPEAGYIRLDTLLSRPVVKSPAPAGFGIGSIIRVFRNGSLFTNYRTSEGSPEGILIQYNPAFVTQVEVRCAYFSEDTHGYGWPYGGWTYPNTENWVEVDSYCVLRVSDSYTETIQLPDRETVVVMDDNTATTDGDITLRGMGIHGFTSDTGANYDLDLDINHGFFKGAWGFAGSFPNGPGGSTYASPIEEPNAVNWSWDIARGASSFSIDTHFTWYFNWSVYTGDPNTGRWEGLGTYVPPGAPPTEDELLGAPIGNQGGSNPLHCGWQMSGNGKSFLFPYGMDVDIYASSYRLRHSTLLTIAGPFGDGRQQLDLAPIISGSYVQGAPVTDHLTTDLPLRSVAWGEQEILELWFKPDETATPSATSTHDECIALWATSLPQAYPEGDFPLWGPYLSGYGVLVSNRGKPEDWFAEDPTVQVLAITKGGGGEWVPIDVESRVEYEDEMRELASEVTSGYPPGYNFWCMPLQMFYPNNPEPPIDLEPGGPSAAVASFRGSPRMALKMLVRPAPFTAIFIPPLEDADPEFPNLTAEAGPPRRTFWPQ